jgi:hypothetical protein
MPQSSGRDGVVMRSWRLEMGETEGQEFIRVSRNDSTKGPQPTGAAKYDESAKNSEQIEARLLRLD